jgi:UDP-glucose 4-epimerase
MPTLPHVVEIEQLLAANSKKLLMFGEGGPYMADPVEPIVKLPGAERVLVTGGAGYIGSHTVKLLQDQGYNVLVLDNLSAGPNPAVTAEIVQVDLLDHNSLEKVFENNNISAVIHFAGLIRVEESVKEPEKYFKTNVLGSINLLNAMVKFGVNKIVYSSSAAVYGNPESIPIKEDDLCKPSNPYGETKLLVEKITKYYHENFGISAVALRYFNAAGASLDASNGENHLVETHLIPRILDVVIKKDECFKLFGSDYPTRDGTAVRDYVHVLDLAQVHILSLKKILEHPGTYVYNVGTGKGYSISQVLQEVLEVTRRMVICEPHPRREGDPAILVADNTKLKTELGYELQYSDLKTIIKTAWEWHKKLNNK